MDQVEYRQPRETRLYQDLKDINVRGIIEENTGVYASGGDQLAVSRVR